MHVCVCVCVCVCKKMSVSLRFCKRSGLLRDGGPPNNTVLYDYYRECVHYIKSPLFVTNELSLTFANWLLVEES